MALYITITVASSIICAVCGVLFGIAHERDRQQKEQMQNERKWVW